MLIENRSENFILGSEMVDLRTVNNGNLFVPDFYARSVQNIDFKKLQSIGVRFGVLDVENTILDVRTKELDNYTQRFLMDLVNNNILEGLFLASNSRKKFSEIASSIRAKVVRPGIIFDKKPRKSFFDRIVREVGCSPKEIVMIGDKMSKDIVGARNAGFVSVLVDPLGPLIFYDNITGNARREKELRKTLKSLIQSSNN